MSIKRKSKFLVLLLSICMILTMMPTMTMTAFAADAERIYINANDPYGGTLPTGMTWDETTNTLTLNNYNGGGLTFGWFSGNKNVTIKLEGTNTITVAEVTSGISFQNIDDVTFKGSGSLNINVTGNGQSRGGIIFLSGTSSQLNFSETSTVTVNMTQTGNENLYGIDMGSAYGSFTGCKMTVDENATLNVNMTSGANSRTVALSLPYLIAINGKLDIKFTNAGSETGLGEWRGVYSDSYTDDVIGANASIKVDGPDGLSYVGDNFTNFILAANSNAALGSEGWVTDGDTKQYTGTNFLVKLSGKHTTASGKYADYEYKFTLPPETTPETTFSFDGSNAGKLMSTTADMKYSLDGGTTWTSCTATSTDLSSKTISETNDIKVKKTGDGTSTSDSAVQTIDITKPAAPTAPTAVDCTTTSNNDGKLQNVTTAMEYQKDGAGSWTAGTGSVITDLENGTYYVRLKATGHALASENKTLTIGGVFALTGTVTISGTAKYGEELTASYGSGNNSGTLTYQWKRGTVIITGATNDKYTLIQDDIGSTITCEVTSSKETGSVKSAATATIEKANGATAPTGLTSTKPTTAGGSNGKISGVAATMEYSKSTDFSSKTDCTGTEITSLEAGTYYVRIKETATTKASAYATVTVPEYTAVVLTGTVTISGTAKYGEELTASYGSGNNTGTLTYQWKRGTTNIGTNSNKYTLVQDDIGKTITCEVRSNAETGPVTSAATAAVEKADGAAAPTGLTATKPTTAGGSDGKISGVAATMEYSKSTDFSSKTDCTGTEITSLEAGTYYVRIKETATTKASAYATVVVPANTDGSGGASGGGAGGGAIGGETAPTINISDGVDNKTGGTATLDETTGTLTITPAEGYKIKDVKVDGVSKGSVTELTGITGDKVVEIVFEKLSDEEIAEAKNIKIKEGVKNTNIYIKSSVDKKGIRITWTKSKGFKVDGYKVYRATSKNGKYSLRWTTSNKSYKNTSVKKGKRYYYKVVGYRNVNGEKVNTKYSITIYRTAR